MSVREKGRRRPGSQPARPFSRPQPPAECRRSAALFAYASAFTAETDCLLEETGFEPMVPLASETTFITSVLTPRGSMVRIPFPPAESRVRT
jgi:hypothetical protein